MPKKRRRSLTEESRAALVAAMAEEPAISQSALAAATGVSRAAINEYLRGGRDILMGTYERLMAGCEKIRRRG